MKPTIPSSLPEPDVPESCLIRGAAPAVVLTAGLKERVLLQCRREMRVTSKVNRVVTGASVLAVAAVVLVCVAVVNKGDESNQDVTREEPTAEPYSSPGDSERIRPNGAPAPLVTPPNHPSGSMAINGQSMPESPGPRRNNDDNCAEELIERLYNRRRIFESGILPGIR